MANMMQKLLNFTFGRVAAFVALFFVATSAQIAYAKPSFAFYYGKDIPWEALGAFDVAVVEPGNVGVNGWGHRLNPGTTVAAYIAVGEVHPTRAYFKLLKPEWKLGENAAWGSIVVDQAAPGWSAFYLAQVIKPLWDQGYRAFFLDTLDSFYLVAKTTEARQQQIAGMANLVKDIKRAYPDAKLIFNRGFEILPQVNTLAYAVAAESLFQGWDAGKNEYRAVPPADRDWILMQLMKCRDDYKLPVIAIDYVDPADRVLARETAQKIKALGVIPWVTNPALDMMGIGQVELVPRQVLAIHDQPGNEAKVASHEIHRMAAMPLSYLGLDVRYVYAGSPELESLSNLPLAGRYAGLVTWFNAGSFQETAPLLKLLTTARTQDIPIVIVGDLPSSSVMEAFGVDMGAPVKPDKQAVFVKLSPHVGFEIEPMASVDSFSAPTVRPGKGDVWLRVRSKISGDDDVIAITTWGAFAANRFFKLDLPQNKGERWAVNPIEFFRAALKIKSDIPVPDVTTESGRRLLLIHVDGDGFPSRAESPGSPLSAEVMAKEFLERYRLPSTVSIIEGEVAPVGLYKALSPLMEKVSRQIFALPHVEIASHTYSHPFYWADAQLGMQIPGRVVGLQIPNYKFDANREISGSRDYINTLAPPGKKTKMLLWTGDTEPLASPVAMAYKAGLLNMNGGFTTISKAEPSWTLVGPLGLMKGDYYQVYAPMQNENVYTNSWSGPFYGYERVIETFEMTDRPLRLKPVNIYYHTYIATKRASIASLHKVYGWAEEQLKLQKLHPVYASEYAERVLDWRRATVARTDDGLELRSGQHLRQWRIGTNAPLPVTSAAAGIAGYFDHDQTRYLNAAKSVVGYTTPTPTPTTRAPSVYLESANAKLVSWETNVRPGGDLQQFRFEGHLPLNARFNAPRCELQATSGQRATRQGNRLEVEGSNVGTTTVILRCT